MSQVINKQNNTAPIDSAEGNMGNDDNIPNHLPPKQQELFKRIQQQQRDSQPANPSQEFGECTDRNKMPWCKGSTVVTECTCIPSVQMTYPYLFVEDDNWYSSDEDDNKKATGNSTNQQQNIMADIINSMGTQVLHMFSLYCLEKCWCKKF